MRLLVTLFLISSLSFSAQAQVSKSPVSMTSFNAVPRDTQVLLSWNPETADVKMYVLEKSKNGTDFTTFGKVQGAENETEFIETDFNPYVGLSYYRLKLTKDDGSVTYSNIVPVKYGEDGKPVSPSASTGATTTDMKDKSVLVIVRDKCGDEYYSKVEVKSNGDPVTCIDPDPNLAVGTYTIVGCSEQELYSKQMEVK